MKQAHNKVPSSSRDDVQESNLRSAAYEAIASCLQYAPKDCFPVVLETANVMLAGLQNATKMNVRRLNLNLERDCSEFQVSFLSLSA